MSKKTYCKEKNKFAYIILWCFIIGCAIVLGFSYHNNVYYSKQLISAIGQDDTERVRALIKNKYGNVDSLPIISKHLALFTELSYSTPLQEACIKGNFETVNLLIEKGADVNYAVSGMNTYSPLMCATLNHRDSQLEIIKLLVENGANIDYETQGEMAITLLAETNCSQAIESLEYLESKGQNVYKTNYPNGSLLHYACMGGNSSVIRYLIADRNVYVNAINSDGETPLILFTICAQTRHRSACISDLEFLLNNGADKTIRDNNGMTAYDYAVKYGNSEFSKRLKF